MLLKKQPTKKNLEDIVNLETYSDIFEKLPTKKKLSFNDLKQQVLDKDVGLSGQFSMILLLLFTGCGSSFFYVSFMKNLGFFNLNIFLSLILFFGGVAAVFFSSVRFVAKFVHARKIFKYLKADILAKQLYEHFLQCDTVSFTTELKHDLSHKLEKINIQQYNPAVYNHITLRIDNIERSFNKLKYSIEQNLQREVYSLVIFQEFVNEIDALYEAIDNAKDIKVLNE